MLRDRTCFANSDLINWQCNDTSFFNNLLELAKRVLHYLTIYQKLNRVTTSKVNRGLNIESPKHNSDEATVEIVGNSWWISAEKGQGVSWQTWPWWHFSPYNRYRLPSKDKNLPWRISCQSSMTFHRRFEGKRTAFSPEENAILKSTHVRIRYGKIYWIGLGNARLLAVFSWFSPQWVFPVSKLKETA